MKNNKAAGKRNFGIKKAAVSQLFFNLDTRQASVVLLGTFSKVREALNKRTELGIKFGHVFTQEEYVNWEKALTFQSAKLGSLKKQFFYLDGRDNGLVYLGQFKDYNSARTASLVSHFGIPQLFIIDGERLLTALKSVGDIFSKTVESNVKLNDAELNQLWRETNGREYSNDFVAPQPPAFDGQGPLSVEVVPLNVEGTNDLVAVNESQSAQTTTSPFNADHIALT